MIADKEFFDAVFLEDTKSVRLFLEKGVDPNIRSSLGATPLMIAAEYGYSDIGKSLLDRGADVNAANQDGVTALMLATCKGNYQMARLLIERNADIFLEAKDGSTVLRMEAVKPTRDHLFWRSLLIRGAGEGQRVPMPINARKAGSVSKGVNYDPCVICNTQIEITATTKMVHLIEGGYYAALPGESCYKLGDSTLQPIGPECLRKYSGLELCAHERNECIYYKKAYCAKRIRA